MQQGSRKPPGWHNANRQNKLTAMVGPSLDLPYLCMHGQACSSNISHSSQQDIMRRDMLCSSTCRLEEGQVQLGADRLRT